MPCTRSRRSRGLPMESVLRRPADRGRYGPRCQPPEFDRKNRMESQDDEIANEKIGGSPKRLLLPSAWLAFYSCTLLLGCLYLVRLVWTETTLFPIPTALLAVTAFAAGILLWFQKRVGLSLYIAIAFGFIAFAAYRLAFDGYTFGRVGMAIGGLLMLAGYSSVAEELPMGGFDNPMDRSGGSAAS